MDSASSIQSRYDEVSPGYGREAVDSVATKLYWLAYDHLTFRAVERVLPRGRPSLRILDAGGGGGKFGARLAERGHHITVLDISPGMLEQARGSFAERGVLARGSFVVGDVAALPFQEESFDLVFCEGDPVSYCLDRHPQAIAELVRVAARGAPVILGVDNRYAHFISTVRGGAAELALPILLTGRSLCPYGLPVHAFSLHELSAAVTAAGAEVIEIFGKPVMFFDVLAALTAARGPDFDPWSAREEILAIQERLAHEGYASMGGHFQVMARRR